MLAQYRLGDGSVVDLGQIGGWEAGTSRLKLGGVTAVGEFYAEASRGLLSVREDGTTIDPTSLGLEESYVDCSDCPRLYTITPNGQRLAWLDGNSLVVVDLGTGAEVQRAGVPGDLAASVDDIALSDNIAVLNRTDGRRFVGQCRDRRPRRRRPRLHRRAHPRLRRPLIRSSTTRPQTRTKGRPSRAGPSCS